MVVHEETVVVVSRKGHKFVQDITTDKNALVADEPVELKGEGLGMNPYELLLSALGACTSMTLRMYADLKKIPLEEVHVKLHHHKIHAKDCADCDTEVGMVDEIVKDITLKGDLTPEQKKRLYEIADRCPVNRTLLSEIKIINTNVKLAP